MKRIKIFLLCVMFVFMTVICGNGHAENVVKKNVLKSYDDIEVSNNKELRTAVENEKFRLLVYDETAVFGLEDKSNGYIWWSSPAESDIDEEVSEVAKEELLSSAVLRYGIPEKRSDNNFLRSSNCETSVTDIDGGIRIFYDFGNSGFAFYVDYTLEKDCLKASLKTSEITESDPSNIATEITLLGSFGASDDTENGYFIIPDGSGALINFNNGKTESAPYSQRIYGNDISLVPERRYSVSEQVYMPVYGIVKKNNAMLAIASEGDANAFISAEVSGQSGSNYNICNFTFVLRSTDTYYTAGSDSEKLTVFENGDIQCGDIEVLYYPIAKENVNYTDVAECYRNYLLNNCNVRKNINTSPLYVELYGGTQRKKSVFGIPFMTKQSLTDYSGAKTILEKLKENGVDNMVVSYRNWTDNGIKNKIDTKAKPSRTLGGKSDFSDFMDFIESNNYEFYPVTDNIYFNGFNVFSGTVRISGSYSKIQPYNLAYGVPDSLRKNSFLLSPKCFGEMFSEIRKNYSEMNGISFGSLSTSLYGDYSKDKISRRDTMNIITENLSQTEKMLADGANAYVFPYADHIINVPLNSSGFDIFDGNIPFFQMVMHGIVPYTSTAFNGSPDAENLLLMSAVTGSSLRCDMIYNETGVLKDTDADGLYYANYEKWIDTISVAYKIIEYVAETVGDSTIVEYNVENSGNLITSVWSNGTVITADFNNKTIDCNGNIIKLSDYAEEGIIF